MKIISFLGRSQRKVIERILRGHQSEAIVGGLWEGPIRTRARAPPDNGRRVANAPNELELVLDSEYLESDRLEAQLVESRELTTSFCSIVCSWPRATRRCSALHGQIFLS
jgi:hypothetical protein